jgi:hypothetical protein
MVLNLVRVGKCGPKPSAQISEADRGCRTDSRICSGRIRSGPTGFSRGALKKLVTLPPVPAESKTNISILPFPSRTDNSPVASGREGRLVVRQGRRTARQDCEFVEAGKYWQINRERNRDVEETGINAPCNSLYCWRCSRVM